jgi:hypothetical protein
LKNIYLTVEQILRANTASLRELAELAGIDPKIMYYGSDFRGMSLSADDVELLMECNARFGDEERETAALLDSHSQINPETPTSTLSKAAEIRLRIFRKFFLDRTQDGEEHPVFKTILKLLDPNQTLEQLRRVETFFVISALAELERFWSRFGGERVRIDFVSSISKARFQFRVDEFFKITDVIPIVLRKDNFFRIFDLQFCSQAFLQQVVDYNVHEKERGAESFVQVLVSRLDSIPLDLALYLLKQGPSIDALEDILSKTIGLQLIESRQKIAEICYNRVKSVEDMAGLASALSIYKPIYNHFLYLAVRSRYVHISVAAIRQCIELGIDINMERSCLVSATLKRASNSSRDCKRLSRSQLSGSQLMS